MKMRDRMRTLGFQDTNDVPNPGLTAAAASSAATCSSGDRREQKGPYPYPLQFTKVYKTIYKTVYKTVYKIHPPPTHPMRGGHGVEGGGWIL